MNRLFIAVVASICAVHSSRIQRQNTLLYSLGPIGLENQNFNGYDFTNVGLSLSNPYSGVTSQFSQYPEVNGYTLKSNVLSIASSNSLEKPVQENQDDPPQSQSGPAIIPQQPPPAVPVNAVAANVPANNGAVFLGSGSLGVIDLRNGQYALGAGGIGYSDTRQQPRPNVQSPLYPPLSAMPHLIPAARPSQVPVQVPVGVPASQISPNGFHFSQPLFVQTQQRLIDQNGYESLTANDAGFGSQTPTIRPIKLTNNYATPSQQQISYVQQIPLNIIKRNI